MHYRFAKREASERKGRQIIATLQAAGVGRRGARNHASMNTRHAGLIFHLQSRPRPPFS